MDLNEFSLSLALSLTLSFFTPSLLFCFLFSLHKLSRHSRKRSYHTRTQAGEKETIRSQKRCLFCPAAIPSPRMRIKYRTKQVLRALFSYFSRHKLLPLASLAFFSRRYAATDMAQRETHIFSLTLFWFFSILHPLFDCRSQQSLCLSLSLSLSLSLFLGSTAPYGPSHAVADRVFTAQETQAVFQSTSMPRWCITLLHVFGTVELQMVMDAVLTRSAPRQRHLAPAN